MLNRGVALCGDITANEVLLALKQTYPDRSFRISDPNLTNGEGKTNNDESIVLKPLNVYCQELENKLSAREKEFIELEETASKAGLSIQALNKQQLALYDEFVLLRQRYDEQKTSLVSILWTHCAKYHPELRQIPAMENEDSFVETEDRVGNLNVGESLGEGQFATVKSCTRDGTAREYALKIIKKDRITSFASLMRVSNEIDNLKLLKSPYVVTVSEVMHTLTKLYIVTEKGGFDLFEFFDEHQDGVSELWAKEIVVCILKGVLYCHEQGICHRDLKPENILLEFDTKAGKCIDLKLCDFGLSTKFKPKVLLTDFCGSPGFFAPEMIVHGAYYGDKADVWSIGCILLELVMGHEKFCDCWMTAYDYEILQDKEQFTASIEDTSDELPQMLNFSAELNEFVLKFLELRSTKRPNVRGLCAHPWLEGKMDAELAQIRNIKLDASSPNRPFTPPGLSPSQSFIMDPADAPNRKENINHNQEAIKALYNNLSEKERRQMEEYILHHKQQQIAAKAAGGNDGDGGATHHNMSLPPITPQTPSVKNAKKLLRKGSDMVNSTYASSPTPSGVFSSHSPTPNQQQQQQQQSSFSHQSMHSPNPHSSANALHIPPWNSPTVGSTKLTKVPEAASDLENTGDSKSLAILTTPSHEAAGSSERRELFMSQSAEPKSRKGGLLVSFSDKVLGSASNSPR